MQPSSLYILVALVTAYVVRDLVTRWCRRRLITKHGCQSVVQYPCKEAFGKDYDREQKAAWQAGRLNDWARERYQICGSSTYGIHTMNEQMIMTSEPANCQVLATGFDDFAKEERRAAKPFFGINIINTNGEAWRRTRDLVNPLFKIAELNDVPKFEKFVNRMMSLMPRDGTTMDMQPLLRKLFIDSATEFIFGESVDTLSDSSGSGKSEEFINALNRATAGAGKRIRPTGFITKLYALGTWDKQWLADIKIVHDYIDRCIARYRNPNQPKVEKQQGYVLIDGMSEAIHDPVELRFQLLGIFSLARETTAMAFSSVLFLLARNPNLWTELRKEALSLSDDEILSLKRLKGLSSFRNTILESFRLHSPITRQRRLAIRDTVLPRGGGRDGSEPAFIPRGTLVWIDKFPAWRDPKIWGEDIQAFRPSRFENKKLGWEFAIFSGGPRMCPAHQQVIVQCTYLLVRLTREFEAIENRDPCLEYLEAVQMCLESRNGCKIALRPAKDI